jgi:hypothetical protein
MLVGLWFWASQGFKRHNYANKVPESSSTFDSFKNLFKDAVKSVLRISSAHNKGGLADINIAQVLHLSNFFELKRLIYIIYKHSEPQPRTHGFCAYCKAQKPWVRG